MLCRNLSVPVSFGKNTSAVVLSVQTVFMGKLNRALVSVALFEVRAEIRYIVFFAEYFSELIQFCGIFMRADRKRCTEIFKLKFFCKPCRFSESHFVAQKAALAALGNMLFSFSHSKKQIGRIIAVYHFYGISERLFRYQPLKRILALFIFVFFGYVRIIKKHRYIEMLRKIFQHIAAARCTTRMKKKCWSVVKRFYNSVGFKLIISHQPSPAFHLLSDGARQVCLP